MADSTTFDIDVKVAGDQQIASAAEKLAQMSLRLTEASKASQAAEAAVKAAEQAYRQSEVAADRAAKSVEKLGIQQETLRQKMEAAMKAGNEQAFWKAAAASEALKQRQAEAATTLESTRAALASQAATLDSLRAKATAAAAAEKQLTEAEKAAKAAADADAKAQAAAQKAQSDAATKAQEAAQKEAAAQDKARKAHLDGIAAAERGSGKFSELAEAAGKLGGPLGSLGQKAFGTAEGLKKLVEAAGTSIGAIAAVAAVVVALAAACGAGIIALAKWSFSLGEAARANELLNEGIAQSVNGGAELTDSIAQLSKRVPQSRDELQKMAADLAKTGLQGKALEKALEDAATSDAAKRLGPQWERSLLSMDKQTQVFKDNLQDIFKLDPGVLESLLRGVQKLIGLFDATSATGNAMHVVFNDVFKQIGGGIEKLGPLIVAAFIQIEIWVLKALIAIKPFGSKIILAFKLVGVAVAAVAAVFGVLAAALVVGSAAALAVMGALIYLGTIVAGFIGDVIALAAAIYEHPGQALDWLRAKFDEAVAWLSGLSLSSIGTAIIQGLANGLVGGGGAVVDAIKNTVGGAIDSAKKLLGIASPSKVFAEIGAHTAAGMAEGVDGGAQDVQGSLEAMVAPPADGRAAVTTSSASSSSSVDFSGATFNFYGVEGAADAESRLRALLIRILEGDALQLGAEAEAPE